MRKRGLIMEYVLMCTKSQQVHYVCLTSTRAVKKVTNLSQASRFMSQTEAKRLRDHGYRYSDEIKEIIKHSKCNDEEKAMILLTKISKYMYNNANIHYGQDYYNTATIAGILRMTIKEFSEKLGVNLSDIEEEKVDVWWTKY